MNLREFTMKYDLLVVFIRHDSAEIWGFRFELTLGIATPKIMGSTGVFVRVVLALKRLIKSFPAHKARFWSSRHLKNISEVSIFVSPKGGFNK